MTTPRPRLPDAAEQPLLKPEALVGLIPGKGRSAIYEAIRSGDIPSVVISGRLYVPTAELRRRWLIDVPEPQSPTLAIVTPLEHSA